MKQASRRKEIIDAHQTYLDLAKELVGRAHCQLEELEKIEGVDKVKILKIKDFMNHARRQLDQIDRRVIQGKKIPHQEKVFSIFKPYTEWISKGKAGVPVELGVMVGIIEDQPVSYTHLDVYKRQVTGAGGSSALSDSGDADGGLPLARWWLGRRLIWHDNPV